MFLLSQIHSPIYHNSQPLTSFVGGRADVKVDFCQAAFAQQKAALTGDKVMSYPSDDGLFIIDTDASDTGIGATLLNSSDVIRPTGRKNGR